MGNSKPRGYWTKEKCIEVALKYSSKIDFSKNDAVAYGVARKNNWLNEICLHMVVLMPRNYWTKEKCHEIALKYSSKIEFLTNEPNCYSQASKKGYINEICSHMGQRNNMKDRCIYSYEFPDNHVYIGLTYNIKLREYSRNNNQTDQVTKHKQISGLVQSFNIIHDFVDYKIAQILEIETIDKYKSEGWIILNIAKPGNLGGNYIKWTKEACLESVKKFKTRNSWRLSKDCSAYDASLKKYGKEFFEECCKHMVNGHHINKEIEIL